MRIALLGAFDPDYPRTRVLREGLRACGSEAVLLGTDPRGFLPARTWGMVRAWARGGAGSDAILVPSFGHRDVPLAKVLASRSRAPLLFDPLVSRWDTQVGDLGRVKRGSLAAWRVRASDALAMRLADLVLCDTWEHGAFFAEVFGVPRAKLARVPVGADQAAFDQGAARAARRATSVGDPLEVVYVGGFLPLHGVHVIVEAAALLEARRGPGSVRFTLIGDGMTAHRTDRDVAALGLRSVRRIGRVPYARALEALSEADVALGIFGATEKAGRVVPHKVYQALAVGVPTVTRRSGALAEFFREGEELLAIEPNDGPALAAALDDLARDPERREHIGSSGRTAAREQAAPARVGADLLAAVTRARAGVA